MEGSRISGDCLWLNMRKRKLILLGCEGKSERAYAALLNRFVREINLPVQIRSLNLEHAGDPLSRVQLLLKKSEREQTIPVDRHSFGF